MRNLIAVQLTPYEQKLRLGSHSSASKFAKCCGILLNVLAQAENLPRPLRAWEFRVAATEGSMMVDQTHRRGETLFCAACSVGWRFALTERNHINGHACSSLGRSGVTGSPIVFQAHEATLATRCFLRQLTEEIQRSRWPSPAVSSP